MTTKTALYRHFDASNRLLYVGISLSAVSRLKQHTMDKEWAGDIVTVTVEQYETRQEALDAERSAIIAEKPLWNIIHNKKSAKTEPVNLWQKACASLSTAGVLYDSSEEAEAAYETRRKASAEKFLRENPTFTLMA